jgi:integrase
MVYPLYKRGQLEEYYDSLDSLDKKTIDDFYKYCLISAEERKADDMKRSILGFLDVIEKKVDTLNLQDLRDFLVSLNKSQRTDYTKNGIKIHLKKFLRWKFKDWSVRFDDLKDIKQTKGFNEDKINESTILKKEQVQEIINLEPDFIKKTYFLTLYESGLRPIELRLLKWKDINFNVDGDISELHIFATKTKRARSVYVKDSTFCLKKCQETSKSDYVFSSPSNKNEPLPKSTSNRWVEKMGKRVGRDLFPYILRHSRATELYLNMPSKVAQKFMGHGQDMSDVYSHISSKEVKDAMVKSVYKVEDLPKEKENELITKVKNLEKREMNMKLLLVQMQERNERLEKMFEDYVKKQGHK